MTEIGTYCLGCRAEFEEGEELVRVQSIRAGRVGHGGVEVEEWLGDRVETYHDECLPQGSNPPPWRTCDVVESDRGTTHLKDRRGDKTACGRRIDGEGEPVKSKAAATRVGCGTCRRVVR